MAALADSRAGAAGVNAANFKLKTGHFDLKTGVNQSQNTADRTPKIIVIGYTATLLFLSLRCCWETNIYVSGGQTRKLLLLALIYAANSHLSPLY